MIGASAHFSFPASSDDVAGTVLVRTEKRATANHAFSFRGLVGVVRRVRAPGVPRNSGHGRQLEVIIWAIPIAGPLPHVACHVVQAVWIRRVVRDGRDSMESVFTVVGV